MDVCIRLLLVLLLVASAIIPLKKWDAAARILLYMIPCILYACFTGFRPHAICMSRSSWCNRCSFFIENQKRTQKLLLRSFKILF